MKRTFTLGIITVILALLFAAQLTSYNPLKGQDKAEELDKEGPKVEKVEQEEKPIESVILVLNQDDITKCLVVSVDGRWVFDAKEVEIKSQLGSNKKSQIRCIMWRGLFKPTTPEVKLWTLETIIMADNAQFQTTLDGLHKGEFSVGPNKKG